MTERDLAQSAARRLAVIRHAKEVSGNIALTCRYYGITRQTFYLWSRRYEELGPDGLRDRSRRPHVSPNATTEEVVGKIVYLRQTYHFGPLKIVMYLKRYHELVISPSGVWRILRRLGLNRLPASQRYKRHSGRWQRYEKPQPGHQVQVDVKFIAPLAGSKKKFYQFTAIADCTRLRVLRIYDRLNQKTAIAFVDYVLQKLPFHVEAIQTDNGSEFQAQFHWHLLDRGIRHVYIKVRTPRLNGKVERSHRIDAEEFYRMLKGVVVDQSELFTTKLQQWEDFYNFDRPHGGLGGQTPYERLRQKIETSDVTGHRQSHTPRCRRCPVGSIRERNASMMRALSGRDPHGADGAAGSVGGTEGYVRRERVKGSPRPLSGVVLLDFLPGRAARPNLSPWTRGSPNDE